MFSRFTSPSRLRHKGILGMNQRNNHYIGQYNDRSKFPMVDDKLKTKLLAEQAGCTVPALIGVISHQAEVKTVHKMVSSWPGFVIKPAHGSGGKGILVILSHKDGQYTKPSGEVINKQDVERHVSNALAGLFSLGGRNDVAIVENLIKFDDCFKGFSYEGVPDVRIIVFKGYPVMAMMRCSTAASDGKANLHQGAVGVGLDIATGKAIRAVQYDRPITHHPDTDKDLLTLEVPHWQKLLTLACGAWEMTGLGYMGTDMVLDKEEGPMVLELNARPGLAIQIANGAGLLPRLHHIESLGASLEYPKPAERVAYAAKQFGTVAPHK
ncbi:alpha-L-glutamate ligase-like protein [Vibrio profundum]|uniref:alpha-L-glutamate ligase-like protein n=1 Tax=Vibrio profundum TaxID=2910247 RepID=UPI003D0BFE1B